tara:strand:- start:1092 stop:1787 length:696 start_codon:yes stop_codon:yes gene_type:complete
MNIEEVTRSEYENHGTSWTRNEFFDTNGYLIIKNLCDPEKLFHPVPKERGLFNWKGSNELDKFTYEEVEIQVNGSVARYWHPQYRKIHSEIRLVLEQVIGRKLYNTYYYDRFYFPGQPLIKHTDRPSCEISVTIHIGTNIKESWPIWIKTPDTFEDNTMKTLIASGENRSVHLEAGDGMVYKGCERPHWRDPMPGLLESKINKDESLYYHQIFFHYVLQDGIRAHHAWDMV